MQTEKLILGPCWGNMFQAKDTRAKSFLKKLPQIFKPILMEIKQHSELQYQCCKANLAPNARLQWLQCQGRHPCQERGSSTAECTCPSLNYMSWRTISKSFQSELKDIQLVDGQMTAQLF